jgi:3-oxoacyl-[acyl-carrier-protein] synthase III
LFGDAAMVASSIGATRAVGFDLTAACSGFLFALVTASQFVETGAYNNVLVIGADALSRWVRAGARAHGAVCVRWRSLHPCDVIMAAWGTRRGLVCG